MSDVVVMPLTDGCSMIAIERQRQIHEEGYSADHDAGHAEELAMAAACYAQAADQRDGGETGVHPFWPWPAEFWKPTPNDRIKELTKAGALIAAAIDSLLVEERDARG